MRKCAIWGMESGYEKILNQVMFEIYKGNLSVEAVICREQEKFCDTMDGFSVVSKGEICKENFDYVIITSSACYDEIKKEAQEIGFEEKQLIDGQKFLLPLFDFERYCQLIENPVTILSDDCWGE